MEDGKAEQMELADAVVTNRGDFSEKIRPMAFAPARATNRASAGFVIPHILIQRPTEFLERLLGVGGGKEAFPHENR